MKKPSGKVTIKNITLVKQPSKKRVLHLMSTNDHEGLDTANFGYLFGFLDINAGQTYNTALLDIINEGMARYYASDLDFDTAFDDMINFLNRRINQSIPYKLSKESCNVIIGVLKDRQILFCAGGDVHAYLFYSKGTKKIYPDESAPLDVSNKLFSYSLNGEILKNQFLYFCNTDFNSVINPYQMGTAAVSIGVEKIIDTINDNLLERKDESFYSALFLFSNLEEEQKESSSESLEKLFKTEQETLEHLSPSILNIIKKRGKEKTTFMIVLNYIFAFSKQILKFFKKIILFLAFIFFNGFFIVTNVRGKRRERQLMMNNHIKSIWLKITDYYNALTGISKAALISLFCILLLLSGAVSYNLHLQKIKELKVSYKQKIDMANALYDQANADVLYQEKNIAVKKLKSALTNLDEVPIEIHDTEFNTLYLGIKKRLYEIQNISEIGSPVLIADFSLEENVNILPPLYLVGGRVGIQSESQLISIDVSNQDIKRTNFVVSGLQNSYYYDYGKKDLYALQNPKIIQKVNLSSFSSELEEIALHGNETINKFSVYNDRLYALTDSQKYFSIWKHNPSLDGFGKPALWATANIVDGANVLSMAIDGNVYVLLSNNDVLKFYRGNKAEWSYDVESIENGVSYKIITTSDELSNIYLLGNDRVSIISKGGDFLGHYLLPTLNNNMQSIAINETTKTIYLLDGEKIYAFSYQP
ncbi:MAG: hypothetical protein COU51_02335 [Parcubacteria group bacterium CG10_big_fil_rev_8_21_14_0_10_36_14]|nr:MAG: hypothetical protein COU51_02335 [Parcubacteria group bacterium CG10_big_fil_rev_8_21_14_0_10_36_14]